MEELLIQLVAADRLDIPLSSIEQRIRRFRKKSAQTIAAEIGLGKKYTGERVFGNYVSEDREKARGMKEAVTEFCEEFPKYGEILKGKISEKRVLAEEHLYFGTNEGCRLTTDDYMVVMQSLGLSEGTARTLYPELMDISRKMAKARNEKRSVIVGAYAED